MGTKMNRARSFRAILAGLTAFLLSAGLLRSPPAEAAALDCAKATGEIDKLVCTDPELNELHQILVGYYDAAMGGMGERDRQSLRVRQRSWLEQRGKCIGQNAQRCLVEQYNQRILVLEVHYGQGVSTEPLNYRCDELEHEIHVTFFKTEPPAVSLSFDELKDQPVTALLEPSDKGEKYVAADGLVFWASGNEASLSLVSGKKGICHLK